MSTSDRSTVAPLIRSALLLLLLLASQAGLLADEDQAQAGSRAREEREGLEEGCLALHRIEAPHGADEDLVSLRGNPRYTALLQRVEAKEAVNFAGA